MTKKLLIIGYGNQAKAWGLNLRDSGWQVSYALREGSSSKAKAETKNFTVHSFAHDLSEYNHVAMLTPDHTHGEILAAISDKLPAKAKLVYAHGYSVIKEKLVENFEKFSHLLLAPKAIASELRFQYENNGGLGAFFSVENCANEDIASATNFLKDLASGLGITVGPFPSSFAEETKADLFSEQSILCSLLPYAGLSCYNKLREQGISAELAYFECWYEIKLIAQTMVDLGPEEFFKLISPNALFGSEKGMKHLLDPSFQKKFDDLLGDIFEGKFYNEVDNVDIEQMRQQIIARWKKEELTAIHNELSPRLK